MDKRIKSLRDLDAVDGTVYGRYNKLNMVNPYKTYFVVKYSDGTTFQGKDLFNTGWGKVKDGISMLQYRLSTGHVITMPKFIGYLPTIEVSESMEGFRLFHSINVNCLAENKVLLYKIILKEDKINKYKIGDVVVTNSDKPISSPHWKMTA